MPSKRAKQKALAKANKRDAKLGKEVKDAGDGIKKDEWKPPNGRPTSEQLGFHVRTGPDSALRQSLDMNIKVENFSLAAGARELIGAGLLSLTYGVKYGLVGRNGVGKSTLLRAIANKTIKLPDFLHIIHVEQECVGDERTALQTVLDADKERDWLIQTEKDLVENEKDEDEWGINLNEIYERLEELDADGAESRAATILSGLGFDTDMQGKKTREYSGGWRMRIALAEALFVQPDLLLLDEPTNHLDVNALTWLEAFLQQWERTVIIVSHDRGFLNKCSTTTMFLHRKNLWYYGGSYDTFLKVRSEHRANQESVKKVQDRRTAHLKQFIARFGQGHKKMCRQAQSRMKMLKKLQDEAVDVDYDDPYLKLQFPCATPLPPPCISVINVQFGYDLDAPPLYENLNFGMDMDSRVAIVGPNGAGKSTFLKLLNGELVPTEGSVNRHCKLRLAKFSQHHLDMMDVKNDSVTHMRRLDDDISIEECRKYLGRFGLPGDLALQPIETLSGGQKSRLAFAELAWRKPHIMLLDEPTNHLDLETIEAMAMALNQFEGGVVLVSHDERLIDLVADELWIVDKGKKGKAGKVIVYDGSFAQYRKQLEVEFERKKLIRGKDDYGDN
jgi:ATP-binding cassette subfamily F protein 2